MEIHCSILDPKSLHNGAQKHVGGTGKTRRWDDGSKKRE